MLKKLSGFILCIILVCLAASGTALAAEDAPIEIYNEEGEQQAAAREEAEPPIRLYIDGKLVGEPGEAILVDDSTVYLPLRSVCEYYDAEIRWNSQTHLAEIIMEDTTIETYLWSRMVEANGRIIYDDYASVLRDDSFMVPARVLAKALNAQASWDDENNIVRLTSGETPIESGESFYDDDDLYWLSHIIYSEAGNQPLEGKIAVGNVVMNRVADPSFPDSIYGVIFQPGQFSPAANGAIYREPNAESVLAAKLALEGVNTAGGALFFQNTAITGNNWMSNTRPVVVVLGNHTFYA